jgi:nucleoside 2-deoxyribosyltransferase
MAFREESEDTFTAIKEVCKERGLKWSRTDQDPTTNRVYQRIVSGIQRATFVIADVTIATLNVYYELGYAEALGKPVIVVAKDGTELPFDTRDIPTTLFRNQTRLKATLSERIDALVGVNTRA